jgi:hypothetical protein
LAELSFSFTKKLIEVCQDDDDSAVLGVSLPHEKQQCSMHVCWFDSKAWHEDSVSKRMMQHLLFTCLHNRTVQAV